MNQMLNDTSLIQVDFAMKKLCQAYSTERISRTLFRYQRAALIDYLQKGDQPFPDIILNEYSQAIDESFAADETPVVDDLGFSRELEETPSAQGSVISDGVPAPMLELQTAPPLKLFQPELPPPKRLKSTFDRFYWLYLGVFVLALFVLFLG